MNEFIKKITEQAESFSKNANCMNSEVQKVALESFQEYTKKSIDAAKTAYVKANQNFTTLTKIKSTSDFSQYITEIAKSAKDDTETFAKQGTNTVSELTAKYKSAFEQDSKKMQEKIQKTFCQFSNVEKSPKAKAEKTTTNSKSTNTSAKS